MKRNFGTYKRAGAIFCIGFSIVAGGPARAGGAKGELSPAHIFQDRMVLQREIQVPVWGWADAGARVDVAFAGQLKSAVAGEDGYWRVNLDPLKASSKGEILTFSCGEKKIELKDVLVGEVWFCAGQSNMDWQLKKILERYPELEKRLGKTDFPTLRFIRYPVCVSAEPMADRHCFSRWEIAGDSAVQSSMALPFFFGRKLHSELNIPVGLVQVAVGGTTQTSWCPREVIDKIAAEEGSELTYGHLVKKGEERLATLAERSGKPFRNWDEFEKYQGGDKRKSAGYAMGYPCVLHNAQVHPFAPFSFRGVIWHQGEGGPTQEHAQRMKALVDSWRELFEHEFIYLWGGLSRHTNFSPPFQPVAGMTYRSRRNLQFLHAQKLFGYDGKSAFCDFYDLGNFNTHFGEKDKAGERFALAALNYAHAEPRVFTGPQMISSDVKPGEIQLKFMHSGSGLVYKPSIEGISGFVMESGGEWSWIEPVSVEKDTLVFRSDKITEDAVIYYGYHANPHETLFNMEGFPASIFSAPEQLLPRFSVSPRQNNPADLVAFDGEPDKSVHLNITHVRRDVYVFRVDSWAKEIGEAKRVLVRIPADWEGAAALHNGKAVVLSEITGGSGGQKTAKFSADVNGGPYVIYNKARGGEALAEADLTRF